MRDKLFDILCPKEDNLRLGDGRKWLSFVGVEKVEEVVVGVKGFVSTGSGEDMLVRDVYQLLVELGKVDEADGLVELVGRLDKQVTAFEDMLEERDIRIDDLEDEIERKVDRIDFLENELVEVRGGRDG